MSGDSTNEWERFLCSGSSGWSMVNDPVVFVSLPFTVRSPAIVVASCLREEFRFQKGLITLTFAADVPVTIGGGPGASISGVDKVMPTALLALRMKPETEATLPAKNAFSIRMSVLDTVPSSLNRYPFCNALRCEP